MYIYTNVCMQKCKHDYLRLKKKLQDDMHQYECISISIFGKSMLYYRFGCTKIIKWILNNDFVYIPKNYTFISVRKQFQSIAIDSLWNSL